MPIGTSLNDNGQFNHFFSLQLLGGNAVKDIGGIYFDIGRGSKFNNTGRLECFKGIECQQRSGIVSFVNDHDRVLHGNNIGKRYCRLTCVFVNIQICGCLSSEERHQCTIGTENTQAIGIVSTETLHSSKDNAS